MAHHLHMLPGEGYLVGVPVVKSRALGTILGVCFISRSPSVRKHSVWEPGHYCEDEVCVLLKGGSVPVKFHYSRG